MPNSPESDIQFLARMVIQAREGDQFLGRDAKRLQELATYGHSRETPGDGTTTMAEERQLGNIEPHTRPATVVRG